MDKQNIALALKYRPKKFEDLIGQESIARTLSLALDLKRLSHAYLFSGLRGSGKTSTARIFAKALICEKGESSTPCEECQNCKSANEGRHIDIIEMDAASNRKIDDIRELIEQTKYQPSIARYKIFIIDEVHMLTKEAFNALLKTLEEPPSYVKFILATTDPLKLPPTILSRTQHFGFKKISTTDILHHLQYVLDNEMVEYEKEALEIIARSGNGSLRDTLTLLDQAIIYSKGKIQTGAVVQMLGILDPQKIEEIFEAIFSNDKEKLRKMALLTEIYDSEILLDDIISFLKKKFFDQDERYELFLVDRFFRIIAQTKQLLGLNCDNSFAISLMLFKMQEALQNDEINYQIKEITTKLQTIKEDNISKESTKQTTPKKDNFKILIEKIYERNYDLGQCFEENIHFVSFENDILTWESTAQDKCKKSLITYWSIIKFFVQDIFGIKTQIKAIKSQNQPPKPVKKEVKEEPVMPSSCVQNCAGLSDTKEEIDSKDILQTPLVKKAIELFDVQKIKIKSKV